MRGGRNAECREIRGRTQRTQKLRRGRRKIPKKYRKRVLVGLKALRFAAALPAFTRRACQLKRPRSQFPSRGGVRRRRGGWRRWLKQRLCQWAENHPVRLRLPPLRRGESETRRRRRKSYAKAAKKHQNNSPPVVGYAAGGGVMAVAQNQLALHANC